MSDSGSGSAEKQPEQPHSGYDLQNMVPQAFSSNSPFTVPSLPVVPPSPRDLSSAGDNATNNMTSETVTGQSTTDLAHPPHLPSLILKNPVDPSKPQSNDTSGIHLCYFAEAVYASTDVRYRYGEPHAVIKIPNRGISKFNLSIQVRTNLCSPSYGAPWTEFHGCLSKELFRSGYGYEMLLAQMHVNFILVKARPDEDLVDPTKLTMPPSPQVLEPLHIYRPWLYYYPAGGALPDHGPDDPLPTTGDHLACSNLLDHFHEHEPAPSQRELLSPDGYLGEGAHVAAAHAAKILTDHTGLTLQRHGQAFIPTVKAALREALCWALAADDLGRVRDAATGEQIVLDYAHFQSLEADFDAAVEGLDERTFLFALVKAFEHLREMALEYADSRRLRELDVPVS
ncbi:hypothetical protein PG987_013433 [Apiospora arundinis]